MRNRLGIMLVLMALAALPMLGQTKQSRRLPDGHPDLQGTYDLATMTPLERLPGDPPTLTKEKADALMKAEAARRAKMAQPTSADRPAPPVGGDRSTPKSFFEILEFKCVEFVEELMYGPWRKNPLNRQ